MQHTKQCAPFTVQTSPPGPPTTEQSGLADDAEAVARVRGVSVNQLISDSLAAEIERVRTDEDFVERAKRLLERDREILDRLAK
jgi:hypothetical protein